MQGATDRLYIYQLKSVQVLPCDRKLARSVNWQNLPMIRKIFMIAKAPKLNAQEH